MLSCPAPLTMSCPAPLMMSCPMARGARDHSVTMMSYPRASGQQGHSVTMLSCPAPSMLSCPAPIILSWPAPLTVSRWPTGPFRAHDRECASRSQVRRPNQGWGPGQGRRGSSRSYVRSPVLTIFVPILSYPAPLMVSCPVPHTASWNIAHLIICARGTVLDRTL